MVFICIHALSIAYDLNPIIMPFQNSVCKTTQEYNSGGALVKVIKGCGVDLITCNNLTPICNENAVANTPYL